MRVNFKVESKRIHFFAELFRENFSSQTINEAQKNLISVKKNWNNNIFFIEKVLGVFHEINLRRGTTVSIFPNRFFLGAVETKKQLVLYGQPRRSKNFSSALIVHELSHIFLSRIKIPHNEIINEIICFLLENQIYLLTEGKKLKNIWHPNELDSFHREALRIAIECFGNFEIEKMDVKKFIFYLQKKINKRILSIKPPRGLIRSLV